MEKHLLMSDNNTIIFSVGGCHQGQKKDGVQYGYTSIVSCLPSDIITNDYRQTEIFEKPVYGSYLFGKSIYNTYRQQLSTSNTSPVLLTLGGDHVISFGTYWASSQLSLEPFLIWIDAHPDIHTYASSCSGNCHGMPMAFILGLERSKKITGFKPLLPNRVVYLGLRSIDEEEENTLQQLETQGLLRFSAEKIRQDGIDEILLKIEQHCQQLTTKDRLQFHVSLDIDSLDPSLAPATGTPVENGLQIDDVVKTIRWANANSKFGQCHLDITEINPNLSTLNGVIKTYQTAQTIVNEWGLPSSSS